MRLLLTALVLVLSVSSFGYGRQAVSGHCFIVTIQQGDTATQVRNLLWNQSASLVNKVIGRDVDPDTDEFQSYVLGLSNVPATIATREVPVQAFIGFNQNVSAAVLNVLDNVQQRAGLVRQVAFNPPKTRLEMETYMKALARAADCTKGWVSKPGDSVATADNTALLARFTDL